jgi:hypothetical protein
VDQDDRVTRAVILIVDVDLPGIFCPAWRCQASLFLSSWFVLSGCLHALKSRGPCFGRLRELGSAPTKPSHALLRIPMVINPFRFSLCTGNHRGWLVLLEESW